MLYRHFLFYRIIRVDLPANHSSRTFVLQSATYCWFKLPSRTSTSAAVSSYSNSIIYQRLQSYLLELGQGVQVPRDVAEVRAEASHAVAPSPAPTEPSSPSPPTIAPTATAVSPPTSAPATIATTAATAAPGRVVVRAASTSATVAPPTATAVVRHTVMCRLGLVIWACERLREPWRLEGLVLRGEG